MINKTKTKKDACTYLCRGLYSRRSQIKILKTVPGKNHFYLSLSGSKNKLTIRKPLRENSVSGQPEVELFKGGGGFRR